MTDGLKKVVAKMNAIIGCAEDVKTFAEELMKETNDAANGDLTPGQIAARKAWITKRAKAAAAAAALEDEDPLA